MITLCTVVLDGIEPFTDLLVDSVVRRTKHISEVLVAKIDTQGNWGGDETLAGRIRVRKFGHYVENLVGGQLGHALGLHACIDRAANDFVLLCDPDVFFYGAVDDLYLDLHQRHSLDVVGVAHHNALGEAMLFFPCAINLLMRKSAMPPPDWGKGLLKRGRFLMRTMGEPPKLDNGDGSFLLPGVVPEWQAFFPNKAPDCWFDIGCNLWLWNENHQGRWLSFPTLDTHVYTTNVHRSNFKLDERIARQRLIYHQTNCARALQDAYRTFEAAYKESHDK